MPGLQVVSDNELVFTVPAGMAPGIWELRLNGQGQSFLAVQNMSDADLPGAFAVGTRDLRIAGASGDSPDARIYYPAQSAGQNASPDRRRGPYPLVVYNHGFKPPFFAAGIDYRNNTFVANTLAQFGFVVICVDLATNNVLFGSGATGQSNITRDAADSRAAIDYLAALSSSSTDLFAGLIDSDKVLVAGHSRGGAAALKAAADEAAALGVSQRIKAVVAFSPVATDSQNGNAALNFGTLNTFPILAIGASEDRIAPFAQQQTIFNLSGPGSLVFEIQGGNHSQFKDSDSALLSDGSASLSLAEQQDLCRRTILAWAKVHLTGQGSYFSSQLAGGALASDPRVRNLQSR